MSSRNNKVRFLSVLILLAMVFSSANFSPAHAAGVIVVNSDTDTVADDGFCTLREAITAANSDTASGASAGECAAGAGADDITFDADYTITLAGSQLPVVTSELTITGNGAANTIIQASTCNPVTLPGSCTPASWRAFYVASTGNLTLDGLTVRHGVSDNLALGGGGISNLGTLTVINSTISGNTTISGGGGISYFAKLTVINSTISGNKSNYSGGGIVGNGTLTVSNSTISGNMATEEGGGVYSNGGILDIIDSTISGNVSGYTGGGITSDNMKAQITNSTVNGNTVNGYGGAGGGIYVKDDLAVTNSTVSNNTVNGRGGGIYIRSFAAPVIKITNSTISGNTAGGGGGLYQEWNTITMINSLLTANGPNNCGNLVADASNIADDASCGSATQKTAGEINLAPLADNGGPTQTHALMAGSAAIDFNASASCTGAPVNGLDQRGETRPQGTGCDTGAFEGISPYGAVRIVKVANPADGTVFSFTDDIEAPNGFDLSSSTTLTRAFSNVIPNSYTVTETDKPGWPLTDLGCTAATSTVTPNLAGGLVFVDTLVAGDTVECTFTNTQCQPGTYDAGGNACVNAPAGSFVPAAGATSPTECPAGKWQDQSGADSCRPAAPGFYVPEPGATEQIECADGFTSEAGAVECYLINNPPTANAGGAYSGNEGSAITMSNASASDPDTGDTLTYAWTVDSASCSFDDASALNPNLTCSDNGSYSATLAVSDGTESVSSAASVTVNNVAPTASLGNNGPIDEGGSAIVSFSGAFDPSSDDTTAGLHYAFDCNGGSLAAATYAASGTNDSTSCSFADNGSKTVSAKIMDKDGGSNEYTTSVTVNNVAPTLGAISVDAVLVPVNTAINASASFTDPGTLDTHSATWDWGDGTSVGTVTQGAGFGSVDDSHSYSTPGVYTVKLTVTDKDNAVSNESVYEFVVVYDPSGGFVTGGGWINSPVANYQYMQTGGKASFGFVAKYKKGANVPDGNTEFQFKAGDLNFKSSSYEWLVVAGSMAQFKGEGTINGEGSYKFMITANDVIPDTFRIKIWYEENGAEVIVYDNGSQQSLGGGSIVVHNK